MKFVCVACGCCVDLPRERLGGCPQCYGERWEYGGTYDRPVEYGPVVAPYGSRSGYGPTVEPGYGRRG